MANIQTFHRNAQKNAIHIKQIFEQKSKSSKAQINCKKRVKRFDILRRIPFWCIHYGILF